MRYYEHLVWCPNLAVRDQVIKMCNDKAVTSFPIGYRNVVAFHANETKGAALRLALVKMNVHGFYFEVTQAAYQNVITLRNASAYETVQSPHIMLLEASDSDIGEDDVAIINKATAYGRKTFKIWGGRCVLVHTGSTSTGKMARWSQRIPNVTPYKFYEKVNSLGLLYSIDPAYIAAVVEQESSWNVLEQSTTSDFGLMQVNLATWHDDAKFMAKFPGFFGPNNDGVIPEGKEAGTWKDGLKNLEAGCYELNMCYVAEHGDLINTYRHYNGGPRWATKPTTLTNANYLMDKYYNSYVPEYYPVEPEAPLAGLVWPTPMTTFSLGSF